MAQNKSSGNAVIYNGQLVITFPYQAELVNKIKVAGGRWLPVLRAWRLPITEKSVQFLKDNGFSISEDIYKTVQALQPPSGQANLESLTAKKRKETVQVVIDSSLKIHIDNLPTELFKAIRRDLTIPNPAYREAVKYGRNATEIPENLTLYDFNKETRYFIFPRGYGNTLIKRLIERGISYRLIDRRVSLPAVDFGSKIKLRDYQKPAVEAVLKAHQGILQAPAGSGKTVMGLEIIARRRQPALWLTHTQDMVDQTLERAVSVLSVPCSEIGIIGAGRNTTGKRLTIGLIQKLATMDLSDLVGRFGLIIIDEAHHSPAATWSAIISQFPAKYRYGLTATLDRADGLEVITKRVIGRTLYAITREQVSASGKVIAPVIKPIYTTFNSVVWSKYEKRKAFCEEHAYRIPKVPYGDLIKELLESRARNSLIVQVLAKECPGHTSLVLSERVEHCLRLQQMLAQKCPELRTAVVYGGTVEGKRLNKTKRKKIIQDLRDGNLDVMFAVNIAKEALDVPRLDRLFLVAGGRNPAETEQKVGRVQRSFPGKKDAVVFDFVDELIPLMAAQFRARNQVYKRLIRSSFDILPRINSRDSGSSKDARRGGSYSFSRKG